MKKTALIILICTILFSCQTEKQYDAIVYGGTPAGITTAISLAQKGKSVLLVEQTEHLGGMYAGGLMTAEIMHMKKGCISGLAEDYYVKLGYNTPEGFYHNFTHGKPAYFFECKGAEMTFNQWLEDYKELITIDFGKRVESVIKEDKVIRSIKLDDGKSYSAKFYVDCSYEGDLMRLSGVSTTYGREATSEFNESFAGIRFQEDTLYGTTVDQNGKRLPWFVEREGLVEGGANKCVNAYNFRSVLTTDSSNMKIFSKPVDYDESLYFALADYLQKNPNTEIRDLFGRIGRGNQKFGFNTVQHGEKSISVGLCGMQRDFPEADYNKRDSIVSLYQQYTKGLFYFLTNDERVPDSLQHEMRKYGYAKDEFIGNDNFPYYFYIRECLRLQGEYVFNENDILKNRSKDDAILLGSHWLDCHSIQKVALSDTSYIKEGNIWHKVEQPYEIPYSVMLPKKSECQNLVVPVCVSASHVGFCSIRLESTWMQLGHAAGNAIDFAITENSALQDVNIELLQNSLREEGMVVKLEELEQKLKSAKK